MEGFVLRQVSIVACMSGSSDVGMSVKGVHIHFVQ